MKQIRNAKDYFLLYLKGIGMGAADVVPGVSGGTIAFISGIYEELIHTIKIAPATARDHLLKFQFTEFFTKINWRFLTFLFAGVGTSIILLSKLVLYLLENHPVGIWSFFFGLIIASTITVYKKLKGFNLNLLLFSVAGAAIAYWVTVMSPTETTTDLWFIFVCGFIAICAMILPGISGSFILLLLGKYQYILQSLLQFKLDVILTFIAGCVIGLTSFAQVLDWLFKRYHNIAVSLLAGFMVGSLNKVWPWKEVLETTIDSHGKAVVLQDRNILPGDYAEITGHSPQMLLALALCIVGFLLVMLLERVGSNKSSEL